MKIIRSVTTVTMSTGETCYLVPLTRWTSFWFGFWRGFSKPWTIVTDTEWWQRLQLGKTGE